MPLNTTQAEQVRVATNELAKKVKLEVRMQRELRELFLNMSIDLAALYALTGSVPNAQIYSADVRGIVLRQYRRTAKAFSGSIVAFLKEASKNEEEKITQALTAIAIARGITLAALIKEIDNVTKVQINNFIIDRTEQDVASITRTNQKVLETSVAKAKVKLKDELEREPTRAEIAASSSKTFRQASFNRVGTIAATTTQGGAEGTKEIERAAFFGVRNGFDALEIGLAPMEPQEIWLTQGDSIVRTGAFNHLAADFQKKENGSFTVSGEKLKFPGDRSLGASAGNVINCRCSAVIVIDEEADIPVAIQVQQIQDSTDFGPEAVPITVPN